MMRRARWLAGGAVLTMLLGGGGAAHADGGGGNPFGRGSTSTAVTLQVDGSYDVRFAQTRQLIRTYTGGIGGSVHDGFRLPDDGSVIPPYLRATYAMKSVTLDGQPVALGFSVDRHRVEAKTSRELAAGDHSAELDYTVRRASVRVRGGYAVYVRTLARAGDDTATVDPGRIAGRVTSIRCVTFAPDSEPCGTRTGDTWTVDLKGHGDREVPNEFVITVAGDSTDLDPVTIDHQ